MGRSDLRPKERRRELFAHLVSLPGHGVEAALEGILHADSRLVAGYLTQYLQSFPDAREVKERAVRSLRDRPELLVPAARLVPWLSEGLLEEFIGEYLDSDSPGPGLGEVLFAIGVNFPERLREVSSEINDEYTQWAMLSGAPDDTVDALLEKWRADHDGEVLTDLAYVRTERAREVIRSLREDIDTPVAWERLLQLAGELPDSGGPSGWRPAYRGFVREPGAGPHRVGGPSPAEVPLCHVCEKPAVVLLRLSAESLPFGLEGDPEFYWYSCDCLAMDSITTRVGASGLHVFYGPQGEGGTGARITPGELSLTLEKDENQVGRSVRAIPGTAAHQVGGLPRWRVPDTHPRCPDCGNSMPYLATMDCGLTPFGDMAYEGIIYCFWCDGCGVSSTLMQPKGNGS